MNSEKYKDLRRKAKELLKQKSNKSFEGFYDDVEQLIEELNTHQMELENQSAKLQISNKNAEKEKEKYKKLYFEAPVAYFTINQTGNIYGLNNAAAELIGMPIHVFNKTSIFPYLHKNSKNEFSRFFKKTFESSNIESTEVTFISRNNDEIIARLQAKTYFDEAYQEMLCHCTVTDITGIKAYEQLKENEKKINKFNAELNASNEELKTTNEELQAVNDTLNQTNETIGKEREQFLSLLNSIPEMIYVADKNTHEILFANKAMKELFGRDLTGEKCYKAIQNKEKQCDFCTNPIIFGQEEAYFWEFHNPTINKDFYIIDRAFKWTDGRDVRFELAIDITKQKQAELALKESEELFKAITTQAKDAIVLIDSNDKVIFWNRAAEEIMGYTSQEIINKELHPLIVPEKYIAQFKKGFEIFKKTGKGNAIDKTLELAGLRKNKEEFPAEISLTSIRLNNELYAIGIIRDITVRKQQEEEVKNQNLELQKLNATKDKFFSIISHDLKNPFNSLLSYSESLDKNYQKYEEAKRKEFIQSINDGVKQTYKLLETLLLWSHSQTGRIRFNPQEADIESIALDNIQLLANSTKAKNICVKKELTPGIFVKGDIEMLNTIFRNLISNAIKFTPVGGEIRVGCKEETPGTVTCYVKDNGVGIEPKNLKKLFQIDKNFSTQGTKNEKGSGLGLILCKEFIEKHNGEIIVDSQPGNGSMFYFKMKTLQRKDKTGDGCIGKNKEFYNLIITNEAIKRELANNLLPIFKETKGKYSVMGVKKFIDVLSSIAEKYEVSHFNFMAEKINKHIQNFDIPKINNCFNELEKIFEKAEIL